METIMTEIMHALPVGETYKGKSPAIGAPGKAPKGVTTDVHGERAKGVAKSKTARDKRGQTDDLSTTREIRIMRADKVPFPRMGDRRALLAPGSKPGKRISRTFAVVEYAGRTCVKVHAGTDDYVIAKATAVKAAKAVQTFLTRDAVRVARTGGKIIGKEIKPVDVRDMSGLAARVPRVKSAKQAAKTREPAEVRTRKMTAAERIQHDHARDIQRHGKCSSCTGQFARVKNARCEANTVKLDDVAAERAAEVDRAAAEFKASFADEFKAAKAEAEAGE